MFQIFKYLLFSPEVKLVLEAFIFIAVYLFVIKYFLGDK